MYLRRYTLPHVWSFYFCWNQGSVQSHMAFRTIFRTVFRIDASPQPLVYIPSKEVCAHFALTVSNYSSSICTYPSSLSHTLSSFACLSTPTFVSHSSHYRPLSSTFHLLLIFASIFFSSFYSINDTIHSNEKQYKRKKSTQKVDMW